MQREVTVRIGLFDDELALIGKLGECADEFARLVHDDVEHGAVATFDVDEFIAYVHVLQRAVMARPARREHPEIFSRRLPEHLR